MSDKLSRRGLLAGAASAMLLSAFPASAKPAGTSRPKIEPVDLHAVFLIDLSGSVDTDERKIMFKGLYDAFTSQEMLTGHFDKGAYYAISFIFYAQSAAYTKTYLVKNPADAVAMAREALWDTDKNEPVAVPIVGTSTHIVPALSKTAELFHREAEMGITATQRAVIVLSDDSPDDGLEVIQNSTALLSMNYGATIHGIPVGGLGFAVADYFNQNIRTPAGLKYRAPDGFTQVLREGLSMPASTTDQVRPLVAAALNLSGF